VAIKIYVLENQPGSNQGSVVVESGTHDELPDVKLFYNLDFNHHFY
jgi:hypothetical protein